MESRLPKPKMIRKATSSTDVTTGSNQPNGQTKSSDTSAKSSSSNGIAQASESLKKCKSTHNVATQPAEDVPVVRRPVLQRAKTHATITRNAILGKTAIKRPGTATESGENKRPNIKVAPKAATSKVLRSGSTAIQSRSNTQTAGKTVAKPRPKWDLKGRLEETNSELADIKENYKTAVERNTELTTRVQSLKQLEEASREKAEKFESICSDLTLEVNVLQDKNTNLQNECEDLTKRRKELEEDLIVAKTSLRCSQERCEKQDIDLRQRTAKLEVLEVENKSHRITIDELSKANSELQNMVHAMDKERRQLHNAIQELKGNIRVFCRVRPKIEKEISKGLCTITFPDECTIEVGRSELVGASTCGGRPRETRQEFTFDKVFPPNTSQAVIFEELSLLVQSALEGYNVCVFAYGQTGSGKTYTMEGSQGDESEGMIPRTVRHIFEEKRRFEILGWEYRIEASFLEIYNEHIVDLLDSQQKTHEIRMVDSKGTDIYVSNLRIEQVNSPKELEDCLRIAQKNRAVAATQSNERSSRSHSVARIRLIGTHTTRNEVCTGTLNLVDLAGSERLRSEEVARTTETKNINKSLANLGNVILALLKKQDHVPYRNSKLTHLLMPSLGGNSKTLMLLNISPLDECYNETLNSLRFASNVNNCKTGNIRRTRAALTASV